MSIEDLPHFITEEIDYEDGTVQDYNFFLTVNRTLDGQWSCGYVKYADEDDGEMALPRLYLNGCEDLKEVALRMEKKLEHWRKNKQLNG